MSTEIEYTVQQQGDPGRQAQELVRQAMEQAKAQIEAARAQAELAREQAAQVRQQTQEQNEALREQIRAIVEQARAEAEAAREGAVAELPPPPPQWEFGGNPGGPPDGFIVLASILSAAAVAALVLTPIARAIGRRMDKRSAASAPPELGQRLERIEQAVEAIAIEVERVSENQRYSTKLMTEMRGLPGPNPVDQWPQSRGEAEPVARGSSERSRT